MMFPSGLLPWRYGRVACALRLLTATALSWLDMSNAGAFLDV